jgi:transcriptional regulator with GAF, ATPase, and Fis domain
MESCSLSEESFADSLRQHGIFSASFNKADAGTLGVCLIGVFNQSILDFIKSSDISGHRHLIAILHRESVNESAAWALLQSGASDVLFWTTPERVVKQLKARFERWLSIESLLETAAKEELVLGMSAVWRRTLRQVVEIAHFSDTGVLILGESGTGKEVVANLIHKLDSRADKRAMVILDCSAIVPELSGSEFFAHERGAFTGAQSERQGAFALANGGTLFLDEVGELPLPLQAQLLRVIQERTYKRVGGSTWHRTNFRLVCATNRGLTDMIQHGTFRADLYFRIASVVAKLPPLRDRLEDIIPLAEYFLRKMSCDGRTPTLDPAVRGYLVRRDYPGNVRELQQVLSRFMHRCADDATISLGYVPAEERRTAGTFPREWMDARFESIIHRAVLFGAGLKEIGRAAEDCAISYATREEDGSLQRAARRLGVTDRALQIRRANR